MECETFKSTFLYICTNMWIRKTEGNLPIHKRFRFKFLTIAIWVLQNSHCLAPLNQNNENSQIVNNKYIFVNECLITCYFKP